MKILLIEDDKEISKMLRSYLMTENFEVVCASDGQMACEAFDTDTYSIVLLDLMIPKLTGMDVMKHIRKKRVRFRSSLYQQKIQIQTKPWGLALEPMTILQNHFL